MQAITLSQKTVQIATPPPPRVTPVITKNSTKLSILGGGPVAESNLVYHLGDHAPPPAAPPAPGLQRQRQQRRQKTSPSTLGKRRQLSLSRCTITDSTDSSIPAAVSDVSVNRSTDRHGHCVSVPTARRCRFTRH